MTEQVIKIYREAGYLIPERFLSDDDIKLARDMFSHMLYDEASCKKCDNRHERHNETCENCASFQGKRQLAKLVEVGKNRSVMLSLPKGNALKLREFTRSLRTPIEIVSKTPAVEDHPLSRPIRMLPRITLYDWQQEALPIAIAKKRGVIKAPPRSGKTLWATALTIQLGCKTLILAAQTDWLEQFMETYIGSETAEACTNAKPHQIKICKNFEDFRDTDICLSTVQKFMNPSGRILLERIRNLFPLVIADEIHLLPALQSSRVISRFNSTYSIGLTGTPARKQEGLYAIIEDLIGPVLYAAEVPQLQPKVEVLVTGIKMEIGQSTFTSFVNRIEYHKKRTAMIADRIVQEIEAGYTVLCPFLRTKATLTLVRLINERMEEHVAAPFYGGINKKVRKQTIQDTRSGKIKALIGNTKLLSTGLNIPRASCLIECAASANDVNCQQRTARILTPMEGKPMPKIVYVLDQSTVMRSMRRKEYWQVVFKQFNPRMTANTRRTFMAWLGGKDPDNDSTLRGQRVEI
jgi:superfamily II DNA or RNA helicase